MGRLERQKRLLMEEANKILLGEAYEGIIKQGDTSCDITCKRKIAKDGSSGDVVKMIQHYLAKGSSKNVTSGGNYGPYNSENSGGGMTEACAQSWEDCDGKFRSETKKAVEEFQDDVDSLTKDGVVGAETLKMICQLLGDSNQPYKSLCSDCDCKDKGNFGADEDKDKGDLASDEGLFDQLIGTADCDKIKGCLKEFLSNSTGSRDRLIGCIKGNDQKTWQGKDCSGCPESVNLMPMIGGDSDRSFKQWCVKNCDTPASY